MAAPFRANQHRDYSTDEPLEIAEISAMFDDNYIAGDAFRIICTLDRPLNPYERRLLADLPQIPTLTENGRQVELTVKSLEDFDLTSLRDYLVQLSNRAVDAARIAESHLVDINYRLDQLNAQLGDG